VSSSQSKSNYGQTPIYSYTSLELFKMSNPYIHALPPPGKYNPVIMFINEVLPAPFLKDLKLKDLKYNKNQLNIKLRA